MDSSRSLWYWGSEIIGPAGRYSLYQKTYEVCLNCYGRLEPHLEEIQLEDDCHRTGAAFALWLAEDRKVAKRNDLEDLVEEVSKFFDEDYLATLKAHVKGQGC